MQLKISSRFANDFKMVKDVSLHKKVENVLETIKTTKNIVNIPQFRSIQGNNHAYKMGIGFYYIVGILTSENEITLMRFLHRDDLIKVLDNY